MAALWRVSVSTRADLPDPAGETVKKDVRDLGISGVELVRYSQVYYIEGDISDEELHVIARELLADPISQEYHSSTRAEPVSASAWVVEVQYRQGVTDAVAETTLKGIRDLGINGATSVSTARKYVLRGRLQRQELETICWKLLANSLIEEWTVGELGAHAENVGKEPPGSVRRNTGRL